MPLGFQDVLQTGTSTGSMPDFAEVLASVPEHEDVTPDYVQLNSADSELSEARQEGSGDEVEPADAAKSVEKPVNERAPAGLMTGSVERADQPADERPASTNTAGWPAIARPVKTQITGSHGAETQKAGPETPANEARRTPSEKSRTGNGARPEASPVEAAMISHQTSQKSPVLQSGLAPQSETAADTQHPSAPVSRLFSESSTSLTDERADPPTTLQTAEVFEPGRVGSGSTERRLTVPEYPELPDSALFRFETIGQNAELSVSGHQPRGDGLAHMNLSDSGSRPLLTGSIRPPEESLRSAAETTFSFRAGTEQIALTSENKGKGEQQRVEVLSNQPASRPSLGPTAQLPQESSDGLDWGVPPRIAPVSQPETNSAALHVTGPDRHTEAVQRNEAGVHPGQPGSDSDVHMIDVAGKNTGETAESQFVNLPDERANAEPQVAPLGNAHTNSEPFTKPMHTDHAKAEPLATPLHNYRAHSEPLERSIHNARANDKALVGSANHARANAEPPGEGRHEQGNVNSADANVARALRPQADLQPSSDIQPKQNPNAPQTEKTSETALSRPPGFSSDHLSPKSDANRTAGTEKPGSGESQTNVQVVVKSGPGAEIPAVRDALKDEVRTGSETRIMASTAIAGESPARSSAVQGAQVASFTPGGQSPHQPPVVQTSSDDALQFLIEEGAAPFEERFETIGLSGSPARGDTSVVTGARTEAAQQNAAAHARAIASQLQDAAPKVPGKAVEITLNPQELGGVRMAMQMSENTIGISIVTERPETLDLLRRHIDQLATEFRELGYDHIDLNLADGRTPNQNQQGSEGETADTSRPVPGNEDESPLQGHSPKVLAGGVDMRV